MKTVAGICASLAFCLTLFQGLVFNAGWHLLIFRISGLAPSLDQWRLRLLGFFVRGSRIDQIPWSVAELRHISDIRDLLVHEQQIVWFIILLCAAIAWLLLRDTDWTVRLHSIGRGIQYVGICVAALCLIVVIQFEPLFRAAHQILFPGGYWEFDPATDIIIQLYPPQFFVYFFPGLLIVTMVTTAVIYFLLRLVMPRR